MGCRVHVVKKHAEYGSVERFNWKYEEFHQFLNTLGCDVCTEEEYSREFECPIEDYEQALELVKEYKAKGDCEELRQKFDDKVLDFDDFLDAINGDDLGGLDYILGSMEAFLEEADKNYRWISFSAW